MPRWKTTFILTNYGFEVTEIDHDLEFWQKQNVCVFIDYRRKKYTMLHIKDNQVKKLQNGTLYRDFVELQKGIQFYM